MTINSIGAILALAVIVVALVLAVIGQMAWLSAGLFIALGIARLV